MGRLVGRPARSRVPLAAWTRATKLAAHGQGALKPLRDRLVHGLGGTMPERGLTYDQLVDLLYPTLPDELRPDVDGAAAGDLARVSTIRRMLGTIEHQVAPTAFSVQLARRTPCAARWGAWNCCATPPTPR